MEATPRGKVGEKHKASLPSSSPHSAPIFTRSSTWKLSEPQPLGFHEGFMTLSRLMK